LSLTCSLTGEVIANAVHTQAVAIAHSKIVSFGNSHDFVSLDVVDFSTLSCHKICFNVYSTVSFFSIVIFLLFISFTIYSLSI
jgi:hypothetical protein